MKTIGLMLTMILVIFFTGISAQDKKEYKANEEGVYSLVEVMPEFPGGQEGVKDFLMQNVKYPEQAKKDSITGKVYIQFVIDESGKVGQSKIVRSACSILDNEAIRVVESMPAWTPGKVNGKAVKVAYTIPIMFALK